MRKLLRSLAFEASSWRKSFPTTKTDRTEVAGLISKLCPIALSAPLIRIGPKGDGGYLVPDDLVGIEACFSPGVAELSGFEMDCANRGMKVYMADRSVDGPAQSHPGFHFVKKYVGATTNDEFMTIDDWVSQAEINPLSELILQIDIEGFEYESFLSMSSALMGRFRIIVGEFHALNQLWNKPFFSLASKAFEKILQTHTCVHIHPNNDASLFNHWGLAIPPLSEFTFVRNDRVALTRRPALFPNPLDSDNTNKPHIALPGCWYKKALL